MLDHVRNASIVVITLDGLGSMVGDAPDTDVRNLLGDVVDEVDALAVEMGLERIKLTGSTYYAVCGVSRPYLDHAAGRRVRTGRTRRRPRAERRSARSPRRRGVRPGLRRAGGPIGPRLRRLG
ncbi:MAG: adenylate/guanylate cyclase domain-containing protein [Ilumatobacteraceae bacterium]